MKASVRRSTWQPIAPVAAAWLAGILEGEGSFLLIKNASRDGRRYLPRVSMQSSDEDTITRVRELSGVGSVNGPIERQGRKPVWGWACSRVLDTVPLMLSVRPFMGRRRSQQIDAILHTLWLSDRDLYDRALETYQVLSGGAVDTLEDEPLTRSLPAAR